MSRCARPLLAAGLVSVGLVAAVPATSGASSFDTSGGRLIPSTSISAPDVAATTRASSAQGPLLKPTNPKCVKRKAEKKKLCGGPFKDKSRREWWAKPPQFRIVDVSIIGTTRIEALSDDDEMRFNGEGEIWLSARKGFGGKFKLPKPGPGGVGIGTITAKPTDWTSRSTGAWITSTGDEYGCGVMLENGPFAPNGLAAMVATNPKKDELSINWNIGGPAWQCPKDLVDPPPFDEKFSDSSLIRYRASSFRGHKLVRLPVTATWSREEYPSRTTVELSGHVLLQRVT